MMAADEMKGRVEEIQKEVESCKDKSPFHL